MYQLSPKGRQVQEMFGAIAPRYDFLNRLLSFGIDQRWRRKAVRQLRFNEGGKVLDIATGTGDLALTIAASTSPTLSIIGIDFSPEMVAIGREKVARSPHRDRITLEVAPCEAIPFSDATFDSVSIAFGIRNVVDRSLGLREMFRVLKPGGKVVILEFATPRSRLFRAIYHFYFHRLLPRIAGLFSNYSAYRYLPESVENFPSRPEFCRLMEQAGFTNVTCQELTFGIATIYCGDHP
jgi:demethylmenaquinone methyltransferase/2-methoxy-6-polyprenyl-1,4-benzoquinol methylase